MSYAISNRAHSPFLVAHLTLPPLTISHYHMHAPHASKWSSTRVHAFPAPISVTLPLKTRAACNHHMVLHLRQHAAAAAGGGDRSGTRQQHNTTQPPNRRRAVLLNVPNSICWLRLGLLVAAIAQADSAPAVAFSLSLVCMLLDFVDGWAARRFQQVGSKMQSGMLVLWCSVLCRCTHSRHSLMGELQAGH